jgi:hypothetical protein
MAFHSHPLSSTFYNYFAHAAGLLTRIAQIALPAG